LSEHELHLVLARPEWVPPGLGVPRRVCTHGHLRLPGPSRGGDACRMLTWEARPKDSSWLQSLPPRGEAAPSAGLHLTDGPRDPNLRRRGSQAGPSARRCHCCAPQACTPLGVPPCYPSLRAGRHIPHQARTQQKSCASEQSCCVPRSRVVRVLS
jgi:hypothetical protein